MINHRAGILIGGLLAALVAVGLVETIHGFASGLFAARLITIFLTIVLIGLLYALTYILTNGRDGNLAGGLPGIFAGAIGGVLAWAIGESLFGPFALTGLLLTALIGGLLFSLQVDPKTL